MGTAPPLPLTGRQRPRRPGLLRMTPPPQLPRRPATPPLRRSLTRRRRASRLPCPQARPRARSTPLIPVWQPTFRPAPRPAGSTPSAPVRQARCRPSPPSWGGSTHSTPAWARRTRLRVSSRPPLVPPGLSSLAWVSHRRAARRRRDPPARRAAAGGGRPFAPRVTRALFSLRCSRRWSTSRLPNRMAARRRRVGHRALHRAAPARRCRFDRKLFAGFRFPCTAAAWWRSCCAFFVLEAPRLVDVVFPP